MPLARRLSPCTSEGSRQYRGKVGVERELPAIRLASSRRSVASRQTQQLDTSSLARALHVGLAHVGTAQHPKAD